jgi:Spy/CpxP family protein refolding chaperone
MRTLEEASTFDEAKVRALAAQQSQAMTEMIVQKARVKNELLQVLTADQRTKLAQFEAKHEQRMRNHMHHGQDPNSN